MISHEHKCIFIHISKCAGSTIESAFGIDISDNTEMNNPNLFGWNESCQSFLQHATPQELFDGGFVSKDTWNSYFKFIIVRNPYSRALSDYLWMMKDLGIKDSFKNFLKMSGAFHIMNDKTSISRYRADHLKEQKEYLFLNGDKIEYGCVIRFENITDEMKAVSNQLGLPADFFNQRINSSEKKYDHYSLFYNRNRRKMIEDKYCDDLRLLGYEFENKKKILLRIKSFLKKEK